MKTLPNESKDRLKYPIVSGCLAYFPAALAGVAKHSYIAGAKYNKGALLHLRYVSTQHFDCVGRHILDMQDLMRARECGTTHVPTYLYNFETNVEELVDMPIEEAIIIEANALAWRALAISQEAHEMLLKKPLAPAARTEAVAYVSPQPISILSWPHEQTVALVKVIRNLTGMFLKEAVELIRGPVPVTFTPKAEFKDKDARAMLEQIGAKLQ